VFLSGINGSKSHENVEDDERCGCPISQRTNENVEKVQNLVHSDRCLSIRAMDVQLNLDKETVTLEKNA
jgi:hypothetical protein